MPARDYGPQFESATHASTAANTPWKTFDSRVSNSDPEAISICKTHPSRQVSFRGASCADGPMIVRPKLKRTFFTWSRDSLNLSYRSDRLERLGSIRLTAFGDLGG